MMDPPISRLNKVTVIPAEEFHTFKDPVDRRAELVALSVYHCVVGIAAFVGHSPCVSDAY